MMSTDKPADGAGAAADHEASEAAGLAQLKASLAETGWDLEKTKRGDDVTILRFLRAKRYDQKKAFDMYAGFLKWRKEQDLDDIVETWEYPELEEVLGIWPQFWHKTDKDGNPINIQFLGELQTSALFNATTEERLLRQAAWVCEELYERKFPACSRAKGAAVSRVCIVLDLANVGIFTFTSAAVRRVLLEIIHIMGSYYPESLARVIILNAPIAFSMLWEFMTPFIDVRTLERIQILRDGGVDRLLEYIDEDSLPEFLGGKCECPNGCEHDGSGPWKPSTESSAKS